MRTVSRAFPVLIREGTDERLFVGNGMERTEPFYTAPKSPRSPTRSTPAQSAIDRVVKEMRSEGRWLVAFSRGARASVTCLNTTAEGKGTSAPVAHAVDGRYDLCETPELIKHLIRR